MVHVMQVHFMFFAVLKNFKSSVLEDNVPEHALDIFIENATKMVCVISLNAKKWRSNFSSLVQSLLPKDILLRT